MEDGHAVVRWPSLEEDELWRRFDRQHNEMIITKAGRCLFPILRVRFEEAPTAASNPVAIDPRATYRVSVSMQPLDRVRWRFRHGRWRPAGSLSDAAADAARATVPVPRLPAGSEPPAATVRAEELGAAILRGVSFESVKVTNRETRPGDSAGPAVTLRSFHRYAPVVHIADLADGSVQSFSFAHTSFVAVTHYQNALTTALKKSCNPHAKGFLPGGAHSRAREPWDDGAPSAPSSMSPGGSSDAPEDRDVLLGALALHGLSSGHHLVLE